MTVVRFRIPKETHPKVKAGLRILAKLLAKRVIDDNLSKDRREIDATICKPEKQGA